ncbi:MAG: hypothetical protein KIT31_37290, partial [Deltaproteobacteria bacterium]|nr:hypothetical protein [Deltaproteobacteria bacterium]
MRFELHCHSTCSDGTDAPARVAERVAASAVDVFALTDHDTCAGCEVAGGIRAVEVTCEYEGRTIHVLAYRRRDGWAAARAHGLAATPEPADAWGLLEERLAAVRTARRNR